MVKQVDKKLNKKKVGAASQAGRRAVSKALDRGGSQKKQGKGQVDNELDKQVQIGKHLVKTKGGQRAIAVQKYIRVTPRKLRLVADLLRGMTVDEALDQLTFIRKAAAVPMRKVLQQAIANALNNANMKKDFIKMESIEVMEGPVYKRWRPVSRGRAHKYYKRTSHIKIVLKEDR